MTNVELARLAEDYFAERMRANPFEATLFGVPGYDDQVPDPTREADQARILTLDSLARRLDEIPTEGLTEDERITRSMLATAIADDRDRLVHALREVSVSGGPMGIFSDVLATVPLVTIDSRDDASAYLSRLRRLGDYLDAVVQRHRQAVADGRTPTAIGVRQALDQLDAYLDAAARDPFLRPGPPPGVDPHDWRTTVGKLLEDQVHPAVRRYRDGLAELLAHGRDDSRVGVCHVPGGIDGYAAAVRAYTTTDSTPETLHQLGLDLVIELRAEFAELGGRVLGENAAKEVLWRLREDPTLRCQSSEEIVELVTTALRRAEAALPDWFHSYPTAPCEVREMHVSEAKGGVLGYYQPPGRGRPGAHVVNTYRPEIRPRFEYQALAFHESVPGHHTQIAVAQTLTDLPDFRRYGYVTVHGEGWGLYAERLADEMGLYSDDLSRMGMVSFDAWRACRLVVDTGMHHLGWSRGQAITFMRDNTALSEANIVNEVDRYIAEPGQALAYMTGRIRIRQLRERAAAALGPDFDIRDFHHQVIGHGPLPLSTLDEVIGRWVTDRLTGREPRTA